jgi:hypothetical protein
MYNFPDAPVEDQIFTPAGGPSYIFKAPVWKMTGTGASAAQTGMLYPSRATAATATIPTIVKAIQTGGYWIEGDGGYATYFKVMANPGVQGFQSADGAWWNLICDVAGANFRQFGAKGDGVTDDRAACQSCIDYCQSIPATIVIPRGTFGLSPADPYHCLKLNGQSSIKGQGLTGCHLKPLIGCGIECSTIWLIPIGGAQGFVASDFSIVGAPRRQGFHGIFIDTDVATNTLHKPIFERLMIMQGYVDSYSTILPRPGRAIWHQNNQANNAEGGMFGGLIQDCRNLGGGIGMIFTGDQNMVRNCIITGENNASLGYQCIGVWCECCTSDGGAGFFTMEDLTIVCKGGGFQITYAVNFIAQNVYMEIFGDTAGIPYNRAAGGGGNALAVVNSTGTTIGSGYIGGCRFAPQGGISINVTADLFIGNANHIVVDDDNSFYASKAGAIGVELDSTSVNCTVMNTKNIGYVGPQYRVVDNGNFNTYNDIAAITPISGFVNVAGRELGAVKDHDGTIMLRGMVTHTGAGTGTVFGYLPAKWWPLTSQTFPIYAGNGPVLAAAVQVGFDGTLTYIGPTVTILSVDAIEFTYQQPEFFAA